MSNQGQVDPISAIKSRIATMSELQKQEFAKETGVDISAVNIMSYEVAEKYCKNHNINLGTTNVWADYNKAKADWNTYHEMYVQANEAYYNFKSIESKAQKEYTSAYQNALAENGGEALNSTQDLAIRRETNYTTDTIKNTSDADMTARALLSKCYMAVDSQRAGLQKGIIGQGYLNIKS